MEPVPIPLPTLAQHISQIDLSQCAIKLEDPSKAVLDQFMKALLTRGVHIIVESDSVGESQ